MNSVNLQVRDRLYLNNYTRGIKDNGYGRKSIMSFVICFSLEEQAWLSFGFLVVPTGVASLADRPEPLPLRSKPKVNLIASNIEGTGSTSCPIL
jgi:hypothetical protein